jgi:uncharacterized protein YdeI (YjbR/CyaY-like superfamily)
LSVSAIVDTLSGSSSKPVSVKCFPHEGLVMKRFESVDDYIANAEKWQAELVRLRKVLLSTSLTETVKWGAPCYTYDGKMVVGLGAFKSYVGLWFYQGALLTDKDGVLINAQEGRTKALRQWRFTAGNEIRVRKIKAYVREAIVIAEQGKEIKPDRSKPVDVPVELKQALARNKQAQSNFRKFGKGKRREFAEYIASAKRDLTKESRLQKIIPMIESGIGLNDKYRR